MKRFRASVTGTAMPTTTPLRQPMARETRATTGQRRDEQVLDQLADLLRAVSPVVARDVHARPREQQLRTEGVHLGERAAPRKRGRVGTRALGEGQGHGGMLDAGRRICASLRRRSAGEGHERGRLVRSIHHAATSRT